MAHLSGWLQWRDEMRPGRVSFGRMLTFCLKKFPGSYFVLIALSRARFGP